MTATVIGTRRVAVNTAVLVLLRLVTPALSVAVVLAVSRLLGREGLGRYTLAFAFLYCFNTLAPLGLYALITRDGARGRGQLDQLLASALTLGTMSGGACALLMAATAMALPYDAATRTAVMILSLAVLPCTLNHFFEAVFVALERMELFALSTLAETLVKVGGAITLLLLGYGIDAVLLAAVAGAVVGTGVSAFLLRGAAVRPYWGRDFAAIRGLLQQAPTFLLIAIFATLYWRIDIFMLAQLRSVDEVGAYGAAWRLLELALILPQSLCLALYPRMAAARGDHRTLAILGRTAMRTLLIVSLPLALGLTMTSSTVLTLLYGPSFHAAANTLACLIWTLLPYAWVRYHAYVLVAADRQRVDLTLNVIMTAVNIALNWALIPAHGHFGAALATCITMLVYAVSQYAYLRLRLPGHIAPIAGAGVDAGLLRHRFGSAR